MNMAGISFRDLEYVVALADTLHFGRAAERCAISQPTMSTQLRKLEEFLGIALFERTPRGVLLSERGAPLVAQARVILAEMRRLGELAQDAAEPLQGGFRLGVIATLGPYLLPLLLDPLRRRHPRLRLLLTEGTARPLLHALEAGELDAVIASPPVEAAGLTMLPLFHETLVLALPRDHPLSAAPVADLARLPPGDLILLNEGHCLRVQALAHAARRQGAPGGGGPQAASLESLRQMIGAGLGYSLLPQLAVQVGSLLDDMVAYRLPREEQDPAAPLPGRDLALFHRPSFGRIREIRLLRELILDAAAAAGTLRVHGRPPPRPFSPPPDRG